MELSDGMLTEISYVNISKYRAKVMKTLDGEVKIPTVIARDSGIRTNHVSKVLSELKAHELIEKGYNMGSTYGIFAVGDCSENGIFGYPKDP